VKRNRVKIAIIIFTITVAAGAVTPLFGNVFTGLFSLPSTTMVDWKSPEGKSAATIDHAPAIKVERGKSSPDWGFGSFILLGSGMLILANWGRRKARR